MPRATVRDRSAKTEEREMGVDLFMRQVKIRNYKSIGSCTVDLGRFTVLVGRNGAGKSNFVDALRFVSEALQTSLDHAIKNRGGIDSVRRRSTGHPRNFALELTFSIGKASVGTYGFEVTARPKGGHAVKRERLILRDPASGATMASYAVEDTVVSSTLDHVPPAAKDRLYLVSASGLPEFRPAYDALLSMGFYNLNPDTMKEVQSPDAGELLHRDGANVASVVARLKSESPQTLDRVKRYLSQIVPGIEDIDRTPLGPKETLEFKQEVEGATHPWRFYANSMSDGTLRALGALIAAGQIVGSSERVLLVGIEEPETALHPAATGALMDALSEASEETQILVTSHSPDLVDQLSPSDQDLLVVVSRKGNTWIAISDSASREAIREHLYTAGELLRMDQLQPDESDIRRQEQMELFAAPVE
jgi:predicted ATPase